MIIILDFPERSILGRYLLNSINFRGNNAALISRVISFLFASIQAEVSKHYW